jgi:hypothetical protein
VIAEGGVIVISILLAFAIDAAWDAKQAQQEEQALLRQIRGTLSEDLASVATEADTMLSVHRRLTTLVEMLESGRTMDDAGPAYQEAFTGFDRFVLVTVRYGPYETLKDRGLDLVSDPALRIQLTSLYEDWFPQLVENSEIDQRLSREQLLPFMLEYLRLDEEGRWVAAGRIHEAGSLGLTLSRYRLLTLDRHYLPSFRTTLRLMEEALGAIDAELEA